MALVQTINVRLPEDLKRHGSQVLENEGVSTTDIVRRLFEYLERTQEIPECLRADTASDREVERKRARLRGLVGVIDLPPRFDAREAYRQHRATRQAPDASVAVETSARR